MWAPMPPSALDVISWVVKRAAPSFSNHRTSSSSALHAATSRSPSPSRSPTWMPWAPVMSVTSCVRPQDVASPSFSW